MPRKGDWLVSNIKRIAGLIIVFAIIVGLLIVIYTEEKIAAMGLFFSIVGVIATTLLTIWVYLLTIANDRSKQPSYMIQTFRHKMEGGTVNYAFLITNTSIVSVCDIRMCIQFSIDDHNNMKEKTWFKRIMDLPPTESKFLFSALCDDDGTVVECQELEPDFFRDEGQPEEVFITCAARDIPTKEYSFKMQNEKFILDKERNDADYAEEVSIEEFEREN